jgi:hypothetical protein
MYMPSYQIFPSGESDDVHWVYYGLYYEVHSKILERRRLY